MSNRSLLAISLELAVAAFVGCSGGDTKLYEGYCTATWDDLSDGTVDSITTRSYTARGDIATEEEDYDADGTADSRTQYTYDGDGNLLLVSYDYDADGQPDATIDYTYNASGEMTSSSEDDDGDGSPERATTWTYHANGEVASERDDDDGDGVWDMEYLYDEDGNETQWGWDTDNDDVADRGHVYTYDAAGNVLTHTLYQDVPLGDTTPNFIEVYTYDGSLHLIEIVQTAYLPVESIRARTTVTWQPGYLEMTESYDNGDDGTVDMLTHKVWDAEGNVLLHEEDWGGDGQLDFWERMEWDGDRLVSIEEDTDLDGVVDQRTDFTYDSQGRVTRVEEDTDSPPDGEPEEVKTLSYDKAGNLKKVTYRDMTTNRVDTVTYGYSCW